MYWAGFAESLVVKLNSGRTTAKSVHWHLCQRAASTVHSVGSVLMTRPLPQTTRRGGRTPTTGNLISVRLSVVLKSWQLQTPQTGYVVVVQD